MGAFGYQGWWARQDSNPQPSRYERPALTIELQAPTPRRPLTPHDGRWQVLPTIALAVANGHLAGMTNDNPIDETGTLLREGGAFVLQRDVGGRYVLELARVPVDHVQKRVRVRGTLCGEDRVAVDGVSAA